MQARTLDRLPQTPRSQVEFQPSAGPCARRGSTSESVVRAVVRGRSAHPRQVRDLGTGWESARRWIHGSVFCVVQLDRTHETGPPCPSTLFVSPSAVSERSKQPPRETKPRRFGPQLRALQFLVRTGGHPTLPGPCMKSGRACCCFRHAHQHRLCSWIVGIVLGPLFCSTPPLPLSHPTPSESSRKGEAEPGSQPWIVLLIGVPGEGKAGRGGAG